VPGTLATNRTAVGTRRRSTCIRDSGTGGIATPAGSRPKVFSVSERKRASEIPTSLDMAADRLRFR
jgi:hypothetical protein